MAALRVGVTVAEVSYTGFSSAGASVAAFITGIAPSGVSKLYHVLDTGMLKVGSFAAADMMGAKVGVAVSVATPAFRTGE